MPKTKEIAPSTLPDEVNFSFYITKAWTDNDSQEMRWCAVNSDTDPDLYKDEMSLELYSDFLNRIETKELPPERHRSDFWSGGIPYLSISHYLDLNGSGVPGEVETVYVDGNKLKSKGFFSNTALGKAAYQAVRENFKDEEKSDQGKVRISIAFVDWGHIHKATGFEFNRESLDDICPECIDEILTGKSEGKIFKKGHLIHLALTRVPVNERTSMEVERSMTTQKEDAASIVGEELAEDLAEKAKEELKADLVIKSETDESTVEEVIEVETIEEVVTEEGIELELVEEGDYKKDEKEEEDEEEDTEEMKKSHVLDEYLSQFKSAFDAIVAKSVPSSEKLQELQEPFNQLGESLKSIVQTPEEIEADKEKAHFDELKSLIESQNENIQALIQEVAILKQKSQVVSHETPKQETVRRSISIDPRLLLNQPAPDKNMSQIDRIARKSVGLQ